MAELNNSSTGKWSETDASNTSPSPDGWPNGTFFNQVEPIGRSTMGAIKRFWDRINSTVTTTGSSGTYTYAPINTSYPTAYIEGEKYSFKADKASAGNDKININGLGAIKMYKPSSSGIVQIGANDIQAGAHITGSIDTSLDSSVGGFVCVAGLAASAGGVTSFTGDGTVLNNSSSTGAVTATLAAQVKNLVLAGPSSGSNAAPTFRALVSSDFSSPMFVSLHRQTFVSNGTYTPTTGMLYCDIEIWGGGGGGGGVTAGAGNVAAGGGAGGYAKKVVSAAAIGGSQTITIGAAGAGGANTGATGSTGGTSSVGSIVSATGGVGGLGSSASGGNATGGNGGTGSNGDINTTGAPGEWGANLSAHDVAGGGGNTLLGGAGASQFYTADAVGISAVANSGSGGGGAGSNGSAHIGGAGGTGYVVITEYCSV